MKPATCKLNQQLQAKTQPRSYAGLQKIKPVVVKHLLPDYSVPLADQRVSYKQQLKSQMRDTNRYSEQTASPRFYGLDPPYASKPQEMSKDLISQLERGMSVMVSASRKENVNPLPMFHTRDDGGRHDSEKVIASYEQRSVASNEIGWSEEPKLTVDQLDLMYSANAERIQKIKAEYFSNSTVMPTVKQVLKEAADQREHKEKKADQNLAYPTYGRSMEPNPNFDTFMINPHLSNDANAKRRGPNGEELEEKSKKPKICSPRRQRFEAAFEKHMHVRYVDEALEEKPRVFSEKFDVYTKLTDSLNVMVRKKIEEREEEDLERKRRGKPPTLNTLEEGVEQAILEENEMLIDFEIYDRLQAAFDSVKEEEEQREVDFNALIAALTEEDYFQDILEKPVRVTLEGDLENLDDLLTRAMVLQRKDNISFNTFLGYFSKKGQHRDIDQLSPSKQSPTKTQGAEIFYRVGKAEVEETKEEKKDKLRVVLEKGVKQNLKHKQELAPKTGRGKYNLTVPQPFEFLEKEKVKSIREQKLEQMLQDKFDKETELIQFEFKPNEIPMTTKMKLYERICRRNEERREEIRRLSIAHTKQNEKPFSFYYRDLEKQKESAPDVPDVMRNPPFRANKIPWKVLVPLYKRMVDKIEHERSERIRLNAERSYQLSRLPPRMEEWEVKKKHDQMAGLTRSQSVGPEFSFEPPRHKPTPNFGELQKNFQRKLEKARKTHKKTEQKPFKFTEPKPNADIRGYLDHENQVINPTINDFKKAIQKRVKSASPSRDNIQKVSTTKKFDAYVNSRRQTMQNKRDNEEVQYTDDLNRYIKQNRMAQRVKFSPAIQSNQQLLKARRQQSIRQAKMNMKNHENTYENQKAEIEYNVANRPLLVEQNSSNFMHKLKDIRELQRHVNVLKETNLNLDEHLTDQQKELLLSAEYYDQLNLQTAYFPTGAVRGEIGDLGQMEYGDEEGEEEDSPGIIHEEDAMEEDGGEEPEDEYEIEGEEERE